MPTSTPNTADFWKEYEIGPNFDIEPELLSL